MGAGSRGHRDRLVGHRLSPALLLRIHTYVSRVFVTGGSGVVGRALVERLVSRGDEVVALARSPEAAETLASRERSEEHTSELQSRENLVCRLLLEKKNKINSSETLTTLTGAACLSPPRG